jgi:hypothetical protein
VFDAAGESKFLYVQTRNGASYMADNEYVSLQEIDSPADTVFWEHGIGSKIHSLNTLSLSIP